jgi:molecular chaperone GrpE (heat shock protein)
MKNYEKLISQNIIIISLIINGLQAHEEAEIMIRPKAGAMSQGMLMIPAFSKKEKEALLALMKEITEEKTKKVKDLSDEQLQKLARYMLVYIPELEKNIEKSDNSSEQEKTRKFIETIKSLQQEVKKEIEHREKA